MSFPNYPNPARRARILQAQQLREQGLTIRQIAQTMDCSVSTAHGYLRDYELFRSDLIHELAADRIVAHMIQLADLDDPRRSESLAELRELRLLLTSLPQIRRAESDRTLELVSGGVSVDNYGNRYPIPARFFQPTPDEQQASQQPPRQEPAGRPHPDVPLAFIPEPRDETPRTSPASQAPRDETPPAPPSPPAPRGEMPQAEGGSPHPEPARTQPNTAEQQHDPAPPSVPPRPASAAPRPASVAPRPDAGPSAPTNASATESPTPPLTPDEQPEPTRTEPNKPEHDPAPTPAQDAGSANSDKSSPPPTEQQILDGIDRELQSILRHRDWLNDYPPHNPYHPERQRALRLIERRDTLLAQTVR